MTVLFQVEYLNRHEMFKSFIESHMNVSTLGNCTIFTMNNLSEMVSIFKFPTCLLRILECYYVIESVS